VPTALLICIKAVNGGLFVCLFTVLGEVLQPKRFAGVFCASPAVALANLLITALAMGHAPAQEAATGMIAGAVALAAAAVAAVPAVRRWGALRGSAVAWGAWLAAGVVAAVPLAGGAAAAPGPGPSAGARPRRQEKPGTSAGSAGDRLFGVDLGSAREVHPGALALRFAFGAALSVVAGLIGLAAGQRAGGVMLGAPALLPATLTMIEKQEGRGPAVTEVKGAVPGAIALTGFAVVAAATLTRLPLAAALPAALAAWVAVGIGGYLAQATVLPSWEREVHDLARQRRDAARDLRLQARRSVRSVR
jgi:Protein of unknown function (DUF3147)